MSSIFSVTPMNKEIELVAGGKYEDYITVANPADATEDFNYRVEVAAYSVKDMNSTVDFLAETDRTRLAQWITIDNPTGTLKPNEKAKVYYTINVPETAPGGGQYATLLVGLDRDIETNDGVAVDSVFEMASILYAKVDGEIIHEGEILGVEVPGFTIKVPIIVGATLKNSGNVHETARVSLEVRDALSSKSIYPKPGESGAIEEVIMPETTHYMTRHIEGISPLGVYDVSQTVNYMGQTQTAHQVVVVCPIWFMALILATTIAVGAAIVSVIKHRRRKKTLL